MSTSFSTKISILAEVYTESLWNSELEDFKKINDIALPLCYLAEMKLVDVLPTATTYVSETWEMLCKLLEVDPEGDYEDSDEMLNESPLFNKDTDEE